MSLIGSFAFFFGTPYMPTDFIARDYINAVQILMDRQGVDVTVKGFEANRDITTFFDGPAAILQINGMEITPSNMPRSIDGVLSAQLLVGVRLTDALAEEQVFELALDVATSLSDEQPTGVPLLKMGPIIVTNIQPEALEGAAGERIACFSVEYEQRLSITRTNQVADPVITTVFLGLDPDGQEGPEIPSEYTQIVPDPEEEEED